jgi:hypothetical protein
LAANGKVLEPLVGRVTGGAPELLEFVVNYIHVPLLVAYYTYI